jgi:ribulose-5-phosphate 4-epimerase/fuculose-1-phosphate aldolase
MAKVAFLRETALKTGISDEEWALRVDLAAAYRLSAFHGWAGGISNHFSVRVPGPEHHFLINPFGTITG